MGCDNFRYKRILLKLSGEVLAGDKSFGIDFDAVAKISKEIVEVAQHGIQIAMVVGGGNIFRGSQAAAVGMDRPQADYMGMLATVINALALQDNLERLGLPTRVQTAVNMQEIAEPFIRRRALRHLEKGRVVIFAAGTGSPYFSTDTAASLRAAEVGADCLLKATKVEGIYDKDPMKYEDAKKLSFVTYLEALSKQLKIMDATAFSLCMENSIPIIVFDILQEGNLKRLLIDGEPIGTLVSARGGVVVMAVDRKILKDMRESMKKAVEHFKSEMVGIRAGRAHPALVENIKADYYGVPTPIKQMGTISIPEPRQILISLWDKTAIKAVEKAIQASQLGVMPQVDGENIRITLPELTKERRVELSRLVKKFAEEARIAIRNIRREVLDELRRQEKEGEISEDELKRLQQEVQDITDEYIEMVNKILEEKEKEILEG